MNIFIECEFYKHSAFEIICAPLILKNRHLENKWTRKERNSGCIRSMTKNFYLFFFGENNALKLNMFLISSNSVKIER